MNNRFFVPVLALGIAALGAVASPSQAATASLGLYSGPDGAFQWADFVTMSGSTQSLWKGASVMEAQDGALTYTPVGPYIDAWDDGPGTFSVHTPIVPPASGHSYTIYFLNDGYSNNPPAWTASTGTGSASNDGKNVTVHT